MITAENKQTTLTERQHTLVMLSLKYDVHTVKDLFQHVNRRDFENMNQIKKCIERIEAREDFMVRTGHGTFEFTDKAVKAEVHPGACGNWKAVWNGKIFKHGSPLDSIDVYNMYTPVSVKHTMKDYRRMCRIQGLNPATAETVHSRFINLL